MFKVEELTILVTVILSSVSEVNTSTAKYISKLLTQRHGNRQRTLGDIMLVYIIEAEEYISNFSCNNLFQVILRDNRIRNYWAKPFSEYEF